MKSQYQRNNQFIKAYMDHPILIQVYRKMGLEKSDLKQIQLSDIIKQSKLFLNTLQMDDQEFYIKRKFESMIYRRARIIKQIYNLFQKQSSLFDQPVSTKQFHQQITPPKYVDQLKKAQLKFFQKQQKYYDKIFKIKLHKQSQYHENGISCIRCNTQQNKNHLSKRSFSQNNSEITKNIQNRTNLSTPKKSKIEILQSQFEKKMQDKRKNLSEKLKNDQLKLQKVQENLQISKSIKSRKSRLITQTIKENLTRIKNEQKEQIIKVQQMLTNRMNKFEQNRATQLQNRYRRLDNKKRIQLKRQSHIKQYQRQVYEIQKEKNLQFIKKKFNQFEIQRNKLNLSRLEQINFRQKQRQKKQQIIAKTKSQIYNKKMQKNYNQFINYNRHLQKALQKKQKSEKQKITKLLEQKIKQEIAKKNLNILNRRQMFKNQHIHEKYLRNQNRIQEFQQLKNQFINQRRIYLKNTLRILEDDQIQNNKSFQSGSNAINKRNSSVQNQGLNTTKKYKFVKQNKEFQK